MQSQKQLKPFLIFFLTIPSGLSQGFVSVALPYILTQHGFSVAQSATVVALGFSANACRFLWGPIVDCSLSLKKWFWIGLILCISTLLLLCSISFNVKEQTFLTIIVFISMAASTVMFLPVNGFMAKSIKENEKGKASGWYQAGALIGGGLGGGAGLWLTTHYNVMMAGIVLSATALLSASVILFVKDIPHEKENTILKEIAEIGKDIFAMLKIPATLLVMLLVFLPIGTGAASNLWSAIALDWNTDADTIALVTGILSGFVSAVGCIIGGYVIDRWGNWAGYLGSGVLCAVITFVMAILPLQPYVFVVGVLAYTFGIGMINAAYTSVILYAIGKRNVATKFSLISSIGNLPVVYMTALNGWTHDQHNSKYMLSLEAAIGVLFVIIFTIILRRMMNKKLIPATIE
jgi:MFS transporter, PAT family, beta-lactamase induction signal transducer AmpG